LEIGNWFFCGVDFLSYSDLSGDVMQILVLGIIYPFNPSHTTNSNIHEPFTKGKRH
jgi:hypothetical protein